MVKVTAMYSAGVIASTLENLKAAAEGEKLEWNTIYPSFVDIAEQEGFDEVGKPSVLFPKLKNHKKDDTGNFPGRN